MCQTTPYIGSEPAVRGTKIIGAEWDQAKGQLETYSVYWEKFPVKNMEKYIKRPSETRTE